MYKPKKSVSVIMSVYNEENTVQKVLTKLKEIEYINEIIVVDNGSSDNSNKLIKNSMKEDNRIKLFEIKKNRGPWQSN